MEIRQQGQQPAQIAFDLGIPVTTVNAYLGIGAAAGGASAANAMPAVVQPSAEATVRTVVRAIVDVRAK